MDLVLYLKIETSASLYSFLFFERCTLEPTLSPVVRPVTVSLAKPVEVCIKKQVSNDAEELWTLALARFGFGFDDRNVKMQLFGKI